MELNKMVNNRMLKSREITNTTEKVVKEYLELYQKYGDIGKERIDQLLSTPKIEVENKKRS